MFAKYSSEKFPLAFIYHVLKFDKNIENDSDLKQNSIKKIAPVAKPNFSFSNQENFYNYFLIFENLRKKSKIEMKISKKNQNIRKLYAVKSVLGLSNDLSV